MAPSLSNADVSAIIFLALVVLIRVRRTYRLSRGAPYTPATVFAYGGFSTVVFVLLAASTVYVAVGTWGPLALALLAPYAAIVAGAAWVAYARVRARVRLERSADGQLVYRLPVIVPAISVVLFVVRVGIEIALFGLNAIATFSIPTTVSTASLLVLVGADLVYGVSIGVLLGRGFGVRVAASRFLEGEKAGQPAQAPEAPLPDGTR
jgi:hypothetical protein